MKILIIDDERNICISLKYILDDEGYIVKWVNSCKEAINTIENWTPDLILLDVKLNFENEFVFFHQFTKTDTYIPFIMLAGINGTQEALRDIKKGAFDFIEKPLNVVKVRVTIKNAINYLLLNYEHNRIKSNTEEKYRMIGESQIFKHTMEQVKNLRKFTKCFFIYGENGTGKELLAYAIHHHSQRTDKPFIIVHTNSTTPDLLELELFGEKNMLDAQNCQIKKGKIELANKGSIFIEDISTISPVLQAKLMRVLQENELQRIGSDEVIKVDTIIIVATNKNLKELVSNNLFREDLYIRLNAVSIYNPPLRDRATDIPLLLEYFNTLCARKLKIKPKTFSDGATKAISRMDFPGNVAELSNMIKLIYYITNKQTIEESDISILQSSLTFDKENEDVDVFWIETKPYNLKKEEFEKKYLSTQLYLNDFNISKTAVSLDLKQPNLSRKIKELRISKKEK